MTNEFVENFEIKFYFAFNLESKKLEDHYRFSKTKILDIIDDEDIQRQISWPKLTLWNSYLYAEAQEKEFYLLQVFNKQQEMITQAIVYVEKSRYLPFKQGLIKQFPLEQLNLSEEDKNLFLKKMLQIIRKKTDLMSLRVQIFSPGKKLLLKNKLKLETIGFKEVTCQNYQKTRFIDIRISLDEYLKQFSGRSRNKFHLKENAEAKIAPVENLDSIPSMQKALDDAFLRTVKVKCPFIFKPFLQLSLQQKNLISLYGFYLKSDPLHPKAFVSGINHGPIFEYFLAGSQSDSELRKYPFNHSLIWNLIQDAKKNGCELFDLGGITSEKAGDPISGISHFKRHFPGFELDVMIETQIVFRPIIFIIYNFIKKVLRR